MSTKPMAEEGFLRRWARLKAAPETVDATNPVVEAPVAAPAPAPAQGEEHPLPTLDDVARLTPESDYSAFVARGVDKSVQRMALKKLFADPNFAVMDGLDIYIDDYNKAAPMTDAMLASLKHAPGVLERLFGDAADGADANQDKPPHMTSGAPPGLMHEDAPQTAHADPQAGSDPPAAGESGMPRQGST